MFEELPKGTPSERNAVFLCLHTKPVEHYKNRKEKVSFIGMISRWNNLIGFPGGKVEEGESFLEALERECKEEVNIEDSLSGVTLLCTHKVSETFNTHLYVKEVSVEELYNIQEKSVKAEMYRQECGGFVMKHLHESGWKNLLKTPHARSVKEELVTLRGYLETI